MHICVLGLSFKLNFEFIFVVPENGTDSQDNQKVVQESYYVVLTLCIFFFFFSG